MLRWIVVGCGGDDAYAVGVHFYALFADAAYILDTSIREAVKYAMITFIPEGLHHVFHPIPFPRGTFWVRFCLAPADGFAWWDKVFKRRGF